MHISKTEDRTKGHQALYDLPASFTDDFDLTYTFNRNRATLTAYVHDLFETGGINPAWSLNVKSLLNTKHLVDGRFDILKF